MFLYSMYYSAFIKVIFVLFGTATSFKPVQFLNAQLPILVTLLLIAIKVKLLKSSKVQKQIDFTSLTGSYRS